MYVTFSIVIGEELVKVLDAIKSYLYTSDLHRRGDWFLVEDYMVIKLCGSKISPYRLPKLLTSRVFILEYVRQLLHVDEICFTKSKKKSHIVYPITLGGCAFSNHKGAMEATKILKEMDFPLDKPWKYNPHYVISKLKGNVNPRANAHERRPIEEKLTTNIPRHE